MNSEVSTPVTVHSNSKKLLKINNQNKSDNNSTYHLTKLIFTIDPEGKVSPTMPITNFYPLLLISNHTLTIIQPIQPINSNGN